MLGKVRLVGATQGQSCSSRAVGSLALKISGSSIRGNSNLKVYELTFAEQAHVLPHAGHGPLVTVVEP